MKKVWIMVGFLAVASASIYHAHFYGHIMTAPGSDLRIRIIGTREALSGANPYSRSVLTKIQVALDGHPIKGGSNVDPGYFSYPALVIPLLAPLTELPWAFVSAAFEWFFFPCMVAAIAWWIRNLLPSLTGADFWMALLLGSTSFPVLWAFDLRQPTIVVFVLITASIALLRRRTDYIAGAMFSIALIKPQLSLPLFLWLLVWTLRRRRWRFSAGFAAPFVALWIAADGITAGWFHLWVASLRAYRSIDHPPFILLFGPVTGWALTAVASCAAIYQMWALLRVDQKEMQFVEACAAALCFTMILVPMRPGFAHDQIMILPIIYAVVFLRKPGRFAAARRLMIIAVGAMVAAVSVASISELLQPRLRPIDNLPFILQPVYLVAAVSALLAGPWPGAGALLPRTERPRGCEQAQRGEP